MTLRDEIRRLVDAKRLELKADAKRSSDQTLELRRKVQSLLPALEEITHSAAEGVIKIKMQPNWEHYTAAVFITQECGVLPRFPATSACRS